jgi:predicted enzyme related to lactoylglutathione lyase
MHGNLRHLAINADDLAVSARFYESVFGWRFAPYRREGFMRTTVGETIVALQQRRPLGGLTVTGFEATVAVPDVVAATAAARAEGGRVLAEPTRIAGIGELVFLEDPGRNAVGAMRYDGT